MAAIFAFTGPVSRTQKRRAKVSFLPHGHLSDIPPDGNCLQPADSDLPRQDLTSLSLLSPSLRSVPAPPACAPNSYIPPAVSRPHQTQCTGSVTMEVIPTPWPPLSRAQSLCWGLRRTGEVNLGSSPDLGLCQAPGHPTSQHAALWMILNPHWARTQSCYQGQHHPGTAPDTLISYSGSSVDP